MTKILKTEWFDHVTTDDLNAKETYHTMIMYCKECKAFFRQKACGRRTILHSECLLHPTDVNVIIASYAEKGHKIGLRAMQCDCTPKRITTLKDLNEAIEHFNFYNHKVQYNESK